MVVTELPEKETKLLEKRNKSLRESRRRTEDLLIKAKDLGLIDIYRDLNGKLHTKKL